MLDAGMSNSDGGGKENGFFGDVSSTISDTFRQYFPVWTAQQLEEQRTDRLNQTTYNPASAPPRINDGLKSTTQTVYQNAVNNPVPTIMLVGGIAAVVILAAFLVKR